VFGTVYGEDLRKKYIHVDNDDDDDEGSKGITFSFLHTTGNVNDYYNCRSLMEMTLSFKSRPLNFKLQ